jgi:DNA mismatch endonuclease (patch repair protein)
MDTVDPKKRSEIMSHIRGKNTKPELLIRSLLHRSGFRFRIHRRDLPGCPDIVLPKYKTIIFVHGCFWHQHPGCRKATIPETNKDFWTEKLTKNTTRDFLICNELKKQGWKTIIVWQCELKKILEVPDILLKQIILSDPPNVCKDVLPDSN